MKHDAMQRMRGYAHPPRTPVDFRAILDQFRLSWSKVKKFLVNSLGSEPFRQKARNNVEAQPPRPNAAVYTHTSSKRPSQVSPTRVTHSQSLRRLARPLCFNAAVPPRTPFSPRRSEDSARVPFSRAVLMPSPRRASRAPPDGPPDLALAEFIRGSMFFHDGGPRAFPRRPSMSSARPGQLRFRARGRFLPPTPFFCYS